MRSLKTISKSQLTMSIQEAFDFLRKEVETGESNLEVLKRS